VLVCPRCMFAPVASSIVNVYKALAIPHRRFMSRCVSLESFSSSPQLNLSTSVLQPLRLVSRTMSPFQPSIDSAPRA
jgi:hypothetical protein